MKRRLKQKLPVMYFITRKQIAAFYHAVAAGKYKGRKTEQYHVEHMFFSAAAANVIK
jgi:hypothetical protein